MNESSETQVTEEECIKGATALMWFDWFFKLCLSGYFTSAVYRWSNAKKDDYSRI